jgi:general secretion pathway protein B
VRIAVPGSDTVREVDVTRGSVPATRTAPPAAGSATRETVKAAVPANLPPSFQAAVSQLRLEALVYAQSPGDRKVFINGRRYLQGDTLDDGILVEKIVEEGAVLSYRGHRYVLRHFR